MAQGESQDPLGVYSIRDIDDFNHSFNKNEHDGSLEIDLTLHEKSNQGFSQSISDKVFSNSDPDENIWKVLLTEDITYNLRRLAQKMVIPIISGALLAKNKDTSPEYDNFSEEFIKDIHRVIRLALSGSSPLAILAISPI